MGTIKSVKNVETVNVKFITKNFLNCITKHTDLLEDELDNNEMYSLSLLTQTLEFSYGSDEYELSHTDVNKNYSSKDVEKLFCVGANLFESLSESGCDINGVSFGHINNDRAFFRIEIERKFDYRRVFTFILNKSKIL